MRSHHQHSRARIAVGLTLASVVAGGVSLAPNVLAEPAPPADWEAIQLQPLEEGQQTVVTDIAGDGTSVGASDGTPVTWDVDGVATALELPEGCTEGQATAIDESGVVSGFGLCGEAEELSAVVWSAEGDATELGGPLAIHDRSDSGIAVGQVRFDGQDPSAFAYLSGQGLALWDADAESSSANAVTEYGFAVGDVEGVPTLPDSVAVGWYGPLAFPLVYGDVESHAIDVTESAHTLVEIVDEDGTRGAIVEPVHGSLIELSDEGDDDHVVDINEAGIVVGTRTVTDGEDTVDAGAFYTPAGGYVAFADITSAEDQEAFGFEAPEALNDGAWVVGNHEGTSWLLRPAAEEEEPTTTSSTVEPTSSTTEPEVTSTTEAPEVTVPTIPEVTIPEVTIPTIPEA